MGVNAWKWAIEQTGMGPRAKLILLILADHHNDLDGRCDPGQKRLASRCECSRATLNRDLEKLEVLGLLTRERRRDETGKAKTTFYHLALPSSEEAGSEVMKESDDYLHRVSPGETRSPAKNKRSRVSDSAKNRVSVVRQKPEFREPEDKEAKTRIQKKRRPSKSDRFKEFMAAHPHPSNEEASKRAWSDALQAGATPVRLIKAAHSYAEESAGVTDGVLASDQWLGAGGWKVGFGSPREHRFAEVARMWATKFNDPNAYIPRNAVSTQLALLMLEMGLTTREQLAERAGVRF